MAKEFGSKQAKAVAVGNAHGVIALRPSVLAAVAQYGPMDRATIAEAFGKAFGCTPKDVRRALYYGSHKAGTMKMDSKGLYTVKAGKASAKKEG